MTNWLNPWADASDKGFQVVQAWFAMAWGGVGGHRASASASPTSIPVVDNDFIFAAIGEELGLLGATAVLDGLPADRRRGPAHRGAGRARRSRSCWPPGSPPSSASRAFIIIAGVTRLLPLTGMTLPFVSYGGSSLVANYVLLALLLRISDDTARRDEAPRRLRKWP